MTVRFSGIMMGARLFFCFLAIVACGVAPLYAADEIESSLEVDIEGHAVDVEVMPDTSDAAEEEDGSHNVIETQV